MIDTEFSSMKIRGVQVHIEHHHIHENRPTLLLIHGYLSSTFSFRRIIPLIKKHFNILALDLPPFGKAEKCVKFVYSYNNLSKIIIDVLRTLKIKNTIGVGHSMGGQILLYAARNRPDLFQKIILICSSGYMKRLHPILVYSSYLPYFSLVVKRHLAQQGIWNSLRNVVYDQYLITEEMLNGYLEPFQDNRIFQALTKMIRDREGDLTPHQLQTIETPCLLVWGEEDRVVPLSVGKRLSEDLPNAQFISLKKTGHLVPEERPLDVSKYIYEFSSTV